MNASFILFLKEMAGRTLVIFFIILSVVLSAYGYSVNKTDWVLLSSYSNETVQEQYLEKSKPSLFYMDKHCDKMLLLNTRNAIRVSPYTNNYPPSKFYCKMGVKNEKYPTYDLGVTFKEIKMAPRHGQTCIMSRLDMYDGISTKNPISDDGGICGTGAKKEGYATTTNFLTMTIKTENLPRIYQSFEAIVTPFHLGTCAHDEFKCANKRCVKNNMLCDKYDNCGDNSDEKHCHGLLLSIAAIIGIVIGGVILVAILITIICCCCCCAQFGYESF